MKVQGPNGTVYEITKGQEKDLVKELRRGMYTDPGSNKKYMERIGNLIAEARNHWINTENEKSFLQDLISLSVLKKID